MTASIPALLQPLKDRLAAHAEGPWVHFVSPPTDQAKLIAAIENVLAVADRWEEDFPHKAWQVRAALTQALGGDTA